jgi:ribose transport system permease protein
MKKSEKSTQPGPIPRKRDLRRFFDVFGPFLGLLLVVVLFTCLEPETFLSAFNIKNVATQTVIVALGAMGMTLIIISGGIDLSVGSVIALSTVVTALGLDAGWSPLFCFLLGIIAGGACGLVNGLIITRLNIVPFIATLGMFSIVRGFAMYLAEEQKVDAPLSWLNGLMAKSPEPAWLILAPGVWMMILVALGVAGLLRYTAFGRYVFAIGSNEATARLCGIKVKRVKLWIYTLAGLFTGLAGTMQFSRLSVGDPTVAMGLELDIIAAVVIGGGSLSGGAGSVLGSMIGAFIMAFLKNGCDLVGVANYYQKIIIGVIIVAAVALDQLRHRK